MSRFNMTSNLFIFIIFYINILKSRKILKNNLIIFLQDKQYFKKMRRSKSNINFTRFFMKRSVACSVCEGFSQQEPKFIEPLDVNMMFCPSGKLIPSNH